MKKILVLLFLTINIAYSQIPNSFNYQGVARDANGVPLASRSIKIKLSILANNVSIYSETFETTTNQYGLFVLHVGEGINTGNFASISWIDQSKKTLRTEIDPDGNGFSLTGEAPLLSVPYALSAKTVETENQRLTLTGNNLSISQGNSVDLTSILNPSSIWVGNGTNATLSTQYKKVGIGTAAPSHTLTVEVNEDGPDRQIARFHNNSISGFSTASISLSAGDDINGGLGIGYASERYAAIPYLAGYATISNQKKGLMLNLYDQAVFKVKTGMIFGNNTETPDRFIITQAGNIGIATSSPTQKLDVNGKVRIQDLTVDNTASKIVVADALGVLSYRDVSTISGGTSQWVTNPTGINYNNGNVGIGATNADATLFVQKNATAGDRILGAFYNPSDANTSEGIIRVAAGTGSNSSYVNITAAAKSYFPNLIGSGCGSVASERLSLVSGPIEAGAVGYINFVTGGNYTTDPNGGKERMRIEHNGNIGIATSTPTQKLDVNGKVRIQDLALDNTATKVLVADATGVLGYKDASTLTGTSQWTNDAFGINYSPGRVSIGNDATGNPFGSAWFHIKKNAIGGDRGFMLIENVSNQQDSYSSYGAIAGTTTNATALEVRAYAKSYFPNLATSGLGALITEKVALISSAQIPTESRISFFTSQYGDASTLVERMRMDYLGNFGIGTIAPTQKLDVNGKVRIQDLALDNTATKVLVADATGTLNYRDVSTIGTSQWVNNPVGINYSSGSVGIGTNNPQAILAIENNGTTRGERVLGLFHNVSDANTSTAAVLVAAGTGSNQTLLSLSVAAKSYFPNLITSGTGGLSTERLSLQSIAVAAGATGFINFVTGGNKATNPDGGIERMRIEHNGNIGIATSTPTQKLDINGKVRIQDLALDNISTRILVADASGVLGYMNAASLNPWQNNSLGINYNAGRVGIGTDAPSTKLHISGNFTGLERNPIELQNTSTAQDAICGIGFSISSTDRGGLQLFGNTYFPSTLPFLTGRLVLGAINSNGVLVDAGSNATSNIELAVGPKNGQQTPIRMILTSSGNVGVGTITPTQKFDVNGKVRIRDITLDNTTDKLLVADAAGVIGYRDLSVLSNWQNITGGINYNSGKVVIGNPASTQPAAFVISKYATGIDRNFSVLENTSNEASSTAGSYVISGTGTNQTGLIIAANAKSYFNFPGHGLVRSNKLGLVASGETLLTESYVSFITGGSDQGNIIGTERMRVDKSGNIGMGTTAPKATLHVNGSVYLENAAQGFIMKSPNGSCWKVTVGDTGTLTSTSVTCP